MPSIRIYSTKIDAISQQNVAEALTGIVKESLHVPIVEVFFMDVDQVFANGKPKAEEYTTMIIEGPEYELEKGNQLCKDLCDAFRKYSGREQCNVSFVYHVNNHDHIGENGVLLTIRKQNHAKPPEK